MTPARLLILAIALAMISNARVALLPGWVVPVPAVLLAIMVGAVVSLAAVIVVRFRLDRPAGPVASTGPAPSTTPAGDGPAAPAVAS